MRSHYERLGVSIVHDADQYSTDFTKSLKYLRSHEADFLPSSSSAESPSAEPSLSILIMGGLGGRVDQAFSQIHHLYLMIKEEQQLQQQSNTSPSPSPKTQEQDSSTERRTKTKTKTKRTNLYLISEESITFILQPGHNKIATPRTNRPRLCPPEEEKEKETETENHLLEENIGIIPLSGPARITTRGLQWDVTDWKTEIGGLLSTSNHVRADEVEVWVDGPAVLVTVELAGRFKRGFR